MLCVAPDAAVAPLALSSRGRLVGLLRGHLVDVGLGEGASGLVIIARVHPRSVRDARSVTEERLELPSLVRVLGHFGRLLVSDSDRAALGLHDRVCTDVRSARVLDAQVARGVGGERDLRKHRM